MAVLCSFDSLVFKACLVMLTFSSPCSDDRQGRKDAKAQLLALPELKHAVYACTAIACGVICFANGVGLPPMKAAALASLPAFGELNESIAFVRMRVCTAFVPYMCVSLTTVQAPLLLPSP